MKKTVFILAITAFAACNSHSSVEAMRDSLNQTMDSQRIAVRDSVTIKSDSNEKKIDSSFKALKDSIQQTK